jgi:hypothetical protein
VCGGGGYYFPSYYRYGGYYRGEAAVDAVLGCTAAVGMVGGAKRERAPHPSNSPALVALSEALPTRFLGDRAATSPQCGWVGTAIDLRVFVPVNT